MTNTNTNTTATTNTADRAAALVNAGMPQAWADNMLSFDDELIERRLARYESMSSEEFAETAEEFRNEYELEEQQRIERERSAEQQRIERERFNELAVSIIDRKSLISVELIDESVDAEANVAGKTYKMLFKLDNSYVYLFADVIRADYDPAFVSNRVKLGVHNIADDVYSDKDEYERRLKTLRENAQEKAPALLHAELGDLDELEFPA